VGGHMHTLVQGEGHRVTHHGQQAAEVALPEGSSCLLLLRFQRFLGFRSLRPQGSPASTRGKASAEAIRAPREPEHRHRHRDGWRSLHCLGC
jgi:hypothetical protein